MTRRRHENLAPNTITFLTMLIFSQPTKVPVILLSIEAYTYQNQVSTTATDVNWTIDRKCLLSGESFHITSRWPSIFSTHFFQPQSKELYTCNIYSSHQPGNLKDTTTSTTAMATSQETSKTKTTARFRTRRYWKQRIQRLTMIIASPCFPCLCYYWTRKQYGE